MGACCSGPKREGPDTSSKVSLKKKVTKDLPVFEGPEMTEESILEQYTLGKVLGKGTFANVQLATEVYCLCSCCAYLTR